jgi:SAM-dependent methyltransferase/Tfp pilus assembly protein PilF
MSLPPADAEYRRTYLAPFLRASIRAIEGGQLGQADGVLDGILQKEPDFPDALHLKSHIALQRGNLPVAKQMIERAIDLALETGTPVEQYYLTRGHILLADGAYDLARESFDEALAIDPELAGAYVGHAHADLTEGKFDSAIEALSIAQRKSPQPDPEINYLCGYALLGSGETQRALEHFTVALKTAPNIVRYKTGFARALSAQRIEQPDPALTELILSLLGKPGVEPRDLAAYIEGIILASPSISALAVLENLPMDAVAAHLELPDFSDPAEDPAVAAWLRYGLVSSLELQNRLNALRRGALYLAAHKPAALQRFASLLSLLAISAFHAEYIDPVGGAEQELLSRLDATLTDSDPLLTAAQFAVYACYRPLWRREDAPRLSNQTWPIAYQELKCIQLDEPLVERALLDSTPVLTPIDEASQAVHEMYEESPFPRWQQPVLSMPSALAIRLRAALPYQTLPLPYCAAPDILVAGCGTGLHAILASTSYYNCRVLAVDLSRASLAYARRKAAELGICNLDFAQADILRLGEIERRFDIIESFGVLHHLRDPAAGLAQLITLLKPDGFMMLGLYSEIARRDVVAARELIARHGYTDSAEDIRRFRHDLPRLDAALAERLARFSAFHALSDLRDLLFHRREHRYTPQGIRALLDGAGLEFLGFEFGLPSILAKYRSRFPDDPLAVNLDNWAVVEQDNPDLFAHCYRFWVRRKR